MKTKAELEKAIVNITVKIHSEYPELAKYISEMPVNMSGTDPTQIDRKNLEEYYSSLQKIIEGYSKTHNAKANSISDGNKMSNQ